MLKSEEFGLELFFYFRGMLCCNLFYSDLNSGKPIAGAVGCVLYPIVQACCHAVQLARAEVFPVSDAGPLHSEQEHRGAHNRPYPYPRSESKEVA